MMVIINNKNIYVKTKVRHLGLYVDQKLTWQQHVNKKPAGQEIKLTVKTFLNKLTLNPTIWTHNIQLLDCTKLRIQIFQCKINNDHVLICIQFQPSI